MKTFTFTVRDHLVDMFGLEMFLHVSTCDHCKEQYVHFAYDDDAYNNGWAISLCADCNGGIAI